ncbi:hypothetical protein PDESU_00073 [Pontiella desulfatans]|uniref:Uncharacterized protein n=1 Tax=Pontiella desulfatans TaxID=2750659 RepID=A0A6C2TV97_PONDE|nr:hypothetical protein [Pontiella desulfatans]VGO11529.1 hypothetical protein PDESU_00073 [Pontiella desulfatans]
MKEFFVRAREWVWLEGDPEKDRSVGLMVSGILEIVLGILAFSVAMLLLVVASSAGLGGMKPSHFWIAMGLLFYLAGWFIVMGLGSMKAKRWARALVLVGAWVTVFFGTLGLALVLYILPELHGLMLNSGLIAPAVSMGILYFVILVLFLLQVLFPMVAIAFYSLRGVQVTCERLHPAPCWTDKVPLPLLAMALVSIMGSLSILTGATTNYVVFLFGKIVAGGLGMVIVLAISVACGYIGWGAFSRKIHAWWGAYALVLLTSSSMMLTFSEMDMETLYAQMGYTAEQIERLGQYSAFNPAMLTFISCIWGIMACVYLVWVRDCFYPEKDTTEVKSYARRKAEEEAAEPAAPRRPRMRLED